MVVLTWLVVLLSLPLAFPFSTFPPPFCSHWVVCNEDCTLRCYPSADNLSNDNCYAYDILAVEQIVVDDNSFLIPITFTMDAAGAEDDPYLKQAEDGMVLTLKAASFEERSVSACRRRNVERGIVACCAHRSVSPLFLSSSPAPTPPPSLRAGLARHL